MVEINLSASYLLLYALCTFSVLKHGTAQVSCVKLYFRTQPHVCKRDQDSGAAREKSVRKERAQVLSAEHIKPHSSHILVLSSYFENAHSLRLHNIMMQTISYSFFLQ